MIVIDTHIWLWWLSNPEKLSKLASEHIDNEIKNGQIIISTISTWEMAMLIAKGRLKMSIGISDWIAATESLPFVKFSRVDNKIALQSVQLPGKLHNDPADRIIIATAITMNASVVTSDRKIIAYPVVRSIW
jgi:PIN domain nuclease of toxin-antitoxin system